MTGRLLKSLLGAGLLSGAAIAQENGHATDQQAGADDPPPSMALLEFVALFETSDGKWMDLTEIPEQLDQEIAPMVPDKAPSEDSQSAPPAADTDTTELPTTSKGRVLGG